MKTLADAVPDWLSHRKLMQSHLAISLDVDHEVVAGSETYADAVFNLVN